ncbi:hypothetical protein BCR33DRAFT_724694, partial [Rhizoclosmatium globosum]
HHILKDLHRHAKKARTFETAKLVRKLKTFQTKLDSTPKCSASVKETRAKEVKKAERDVGLIKVHTLIKNRKHKTITSQSEPDEPASTPSDSVTDKDAVNRLGARIIETTEFKRALETGIEDLRKILQSSEEGVKKVKLTQKERKALNKKRKLEAMQQNGGEGDEEDEGPASDDDNDDPMDVDVGKLQSPTKKPTKAIPTKTSSSTASAKSKPTPKAVPSSAPSKPSSKASSKMESAFLETLGGDTLSDVEFSDFSEDDEIPGAKQLEKKSKTSKKDEPKKKKRPGRGRDKRKMWEEQYGKKANHIVNRELTLVNKIKKAPVAAPVVDEKLHPSWAAKKAQKLQISAVPAGKKISFGDDGKLHPSWAAKKAQKLQISAVPAGKKITFGDDSGSSKKPEPVDEKLHPSWAAKKSKVLRLEVQLEQSIRETTPKQPEPVDEKLHPSWAAKKKQSAAIGGATGTKVVFGDDD